MALLADAANVSREGKLNVLGVFDTIYARQFPTVHPHMALVLRLEAASDEEGPHDIEVQLVAPDGTVLVRAPGTVTLPGFAPGDPIGFDHVLSFANTRFAGPGRYAVRVAVDGVVVVALVLRVAEPPTAH